MQAREKIIVAANGKDGDHGFQYYGHRDAVAQAGRNGANGRSSCAPTAGTDGRDITVGLTWSDEEGIVVEGTKLWKGTRWVVPQDQILLLNCKGGDGGNGGNGEDGQQGGQGARGRNATKHRDAENGYEGARGGDGGYGTNGSNGGSAGKVLISVNEDDLDLMLPVFWDIRGGKGGASGSHGDPGDGGLGGEGGDGLTWTEHRGNTTITRTRGPGQRGPVGPPGARPPTYLQGGVGGAQGSSQVRVIRNDGTEATYPSQYELKVVSFDVVDENEDGINEPGEHLLVKNIRVQNTGGMPSPKNRDIRVLIHGTHWLDPIMSEPVLLPKGIPVDEIVEVPGVLRAFIMQERVPRDPAKPFFMSDEVQLIATMERIERTIPKFSGATRIEIKYPLELDPPKYLDCIAPGDQITFSWTLRNISTKPYGIHGSLRRSGGTCLTDPGKLFNFLEAEGTEHEMVDLLDELEPGAEVPISQTFQVSDLAYPYSEGNLKLELLLSEPGMNEARFSTVPSNHPGMRSVMSHAIKMQISGVYHFNPNSSYLLVVNSQMANSVIHQVIAFVRNELKLNLDIFNLSIGGTFIDPATQRNVLSKYVGKSVVIFGNPFPYFGLGNKSAFDLLDPWFACQLANAGTSFHFAGASGTLPKSVIDNWASMAAFPMFAFDSSQNEKPSIGSLRVQSMKDLVIGLHQSSNTASDMLLTHSFFSKKYACKSQDSSLASSAKKAASQLNKNFPLCRYVVTTDTTSRTAEIPGMVIVRQSFTKTANISAGLMAYATEGAEISDYNKYMIVSTLPFKTRALMFWNMAGISNATGVVPVNEKIFEFVCLSIEYDLGREIARFFFQAPWPEVIPKENSLKQLTLLNQFFEMQPPSQVLNSSGGKGFLIQTLGFIEGSLLPIGFGQNFSHIFGDRRSNLTPQVVAKVDQILSQRFTPDVCVSLKTEITANAKNTKKLVKGIQGAKDTTSVFWSRFATSTATANASFFDLTTVCLASESWSAEVAHKKTSDFNQHGAGIQHHETHATSIRGQMISPVTG